MVRRIDTAAAWAAYQGGHRGVREWLATLPGDSWRLPSVLPGWTVADLAAHIAMIPESAWAIAPAGRAVRASTIGQYVSSFSQSSAAIAERAREIAVDGDQRPEQILAAVDERFAAAVKSVEALGMEDRVVTTRRVPLRLGDFLATRVIEVVVHADDLARSVPDVSAPELPRDAERIAVRAMLDALVERVPGRSVEVRVPPHAAVQCVAGPRHTRGTPPNVVEMAPAVWIRLAAGRATWDDEIDAGAVAASGDRANLSAHLPLF